MRLEVKISSFIDVGTERGLFGVHGPIFARQLFLGSLSDSQG